MSGPQSLKNYPAAFKKESRASLKLNFLSHDFNPGNTINRSANRKDTKKLDEENLSSSGSDDDQ